MWTNGPEVDKTRQGLEVRGLGQDREGPRPRAMSGGGRVGGNDGGKPPEGLRSQHHSRHESWYLPTLSGMVPAA